MGQTPLDSNVLFPHSPPKERKVSKLTFFFHSCHDVLDSPESIAALCECLQKSPHSKTTAQALDILVALMQDNRKWVILCESNSVHSVRPVCLCMAICLAEIGESLPNFYTLPL